MKKSLLIVLFLVLGVMCYAVIAQQKKQASPKDERREVREQRRAVRLEQFTKMMDSLVLSRTFQFNPQSMQRLPAGPMRIISNPNFNIGLWDGTIDICLPYVKGYVPPYYLTVLNYTVPSVQNYTTEQTHDGWTITFSTTLFSASVYTFSFEISSQMGGATLTITNPWYSPVQYTGTISKLY
ncbi:MAG: DUF4251 domain-containing protein [Alistipes sp.]